MVKSIRVGVIASGGGTDLQSIIDASEKGIIDASVVVVISDNESAYALERAKKHKISSVFLNPKNLNRISYDKQLNVECEKYNLDLLVGAGYMRILSDFFVEQWFGIFLKELVYYANTPSIMARYMFLYCCALERLRI